MKRILAIAIATCLLLPAGARAATAELRFDGRVSDNVNGTFNQYTLIYRAAPGETNHLTVNGTHLADTSAPITPGTGCRSDGDGVTCTGDGPSEYDGDYDLGDGDDSATGVGNGPVNGGPGNDSVVGHNIIFDGGTGADSLGCDSPYGIVAFTYKNRQAPVDASLDGVANDGEAGEGDNIDPCVSDITGGSGGDHLAGGSATRAYLYGGGGDDHLQAGPLGDSLDGGDSADVLDGGSGADGLVGGAGNDTLTGGEGADALSGGAGNDTIDAGGGNDTIFDDEGDDHVDAGAGDDTLMAGTGHDVLDGGDGSDTADYSRRTENLRITLDGQANDGAAGEDDQLVDVENAAGGSGTDVITGDDGPNRLDSSGGRDTIDGGGGDDVLTASRGSGVKLTGGSGRDHFNNVGASDVVEGRDGEVDSVECTVRGKAVLHVDAIDVHPSCDPAVSVGFPRAGAQLRADRHGAFHIRVKCGSASPTSCAGVLRLIYVPQSVSVTSRVLARTTFRLKPGRSVVLRPRLSRAELRELRRLRRWPVQGSLKAGRLHPIHAWTLLPPAR